MDGLYATRLHVKMAVTCFWQKAIASSQINALTPSPSVAIPNTCRQEQRNSSKMDAYNNAMDKIGAAIIDWSDPDGTWRADREVRDSMHAKKGKNTITTNYGTTF